MDLGHSSMEKTSLVDIQMYLKIGLGESDSLKSSEYGK